MVIDVTTMTFAQAKELGIFEEYKQAMAEKALKDNRTINKDCAEAGQPLYTDWEFADRPYVDTPDGRFFH